jgi:hypothetical protein
MKPVLTGKVPFHDYVDRAIMSAVTIGDKRPSRPPAEVGVKISDELWDLITSCWVLDPEARPIMRKVLEELTRICESLKPKEIRSSTQHNHTNDQSIYERQGIQVRPRSPVKKRKHNKRIKKLFTCIIS